MRYFSGLIFLAIMAYLGWPYVHIYHLNNAVKSNDKTAIEKLVDFEEVNKIHKETLEWKVKNSVGSKGNSLLPESIRESAEAITGAVGNLAAKTVVIDANEIVERLRHFEGSLWEQLTFAFFESPTRFTVRLGKLGRNPIHVQMTMQDWSWRVTAIYD
ncbi:DUF2939 domain-containing protein [Candidatus Parabeggiatoa sp. HSG14]|uniref:DUF2939 domain-containing protein n=1 Tax=Candidatus Parabeggiatoa sp. HSG14 TaxID=3055593 RepID=UPI0025A8510E|nr:DUF2939 domain-containing protein [Thiotrichales bacterium HSG14]